MAGGWGVGGGGVGRCSIPAGSFLETESSILTARPPPHSTLTFINYLHNQLTRVQAFVRCCRFVSVCPALARCRSRVGKSNRSVLVIGLSLIHI